MDITDLPIKCDDKYRDRLSRMSWQRSVHGYARHCWKDGKRVRWASMHRVIWAWEYGQENLPRYIDHINRDRMDNRLCNLRAATLSLNAHNCRRPRRKHHLLPAGVYRNRLSGSSPYGASISHCNKTIYLGVFASLDEASAAYEHAKSLIVEFEAALARGVVPEPLDLRIKRSERGRPKRREPALVRTLYQSGRTLAQVAAELGCCSWTAARMLKEAGLTLRRGRPPKHARRAGA